MNQELISTLSTIFQQQGSHIDRERKIGEDSLKQLEQDINYPLNLLYFISNAVGNSEQQLRAVLSIKNWCQKYQNFDEIYIQQYSNVIGTIKENILSLILSSNNKTAEYLIDAAHFLSVREFPYRWKNLAQDLMKVLSPNNHLQSFRSLKLLFKITRRYDYSLRSDPLYEEIILVCDDTHDILLQYAQFLLQNVSSLTGNAENLDQILKLIKILMKIFHTLNAQDLHPKFEDNLNAWMKILSEVLQINSTLQTTDKFIIFKCKGEALRCVLLYATKYREDFQSLIQGFSQEIWQICMNSSEDGKYDKIVVNALKYFRSLIFWQEMQEFFTGNLIILFNSLIIPNLKLSKRDIGMFKEEPQQFIEVYFENAELNSRRTATVELLKNITKQFKNGVNSFLQNLIQQYDHQLKSTKQHNFENEIVLINILCDGCSVAFRPKDGVSQVGIQEELIVYVYENLVKYQLVQIFQSIQGQQEAPIDDKCQIVHNFYLLRFLFFYRNYINKQDIGDLVRILSFLLKTNSPCFRMAVSYTIENLLKIKTGDIKSFTNIQLFFDKHTITSFIPSVLENLYFCSKKLQSLDNYLIRAQLSIIQIMKENVCQYVAPFSDFYKDLLSKLIQGYTFQSAYLIFEGMGTLIYYICKENPDLIQQVEGMWNPDLNNIFSRNLTALIGFAFQIFAMIVQGYSSNSNQAGQIKDSYSIIYNSILNQNNWIQDNVSIFPAYIIYIENFLKLCPNKIMENMKEIREIILFSLLKYNQSKLFFSFCFDLIVSMDLQVFYSQGYFSYIFGQSLNNYNMQMRSKGQNTENIKFIKEFYLFLCNCFIHYDALTLLQLIQQNNLEVLNFLAQEVQIVKTTINRTEKKTIFVGLINLMMNCFSQLNIQIFSILLNSLIENIANRRYYKNRKIFTTSFNNKEEVIQDSGFQKLTLVQDKKLLNCRIEIEDEEKYFALKFNQFYENPALGGSLNIQEIIPLQSNQEMLTKIIQESQATSHN